MTRYIVALILLLCGCSVVNKDTRIHIPKSELCSLQIEGMEFSDSGDKLFFWTLEHLYTYKINYEANTSPAVFLLGRTSLMEKTTAGMHIKELDAIRARIKKDLNPDHFYYPSGGATSLYAPYNVTVDSDGYDFSLKTSLKKYVVKSGKRIIYSLSIKDITKAKLDYPSEVHYSYLSPKGKYGYFIFPFQRRYGIHTRRFLPSLTVPIRKSYHVVVDITNRKIISHRRENKLNIVDALYLKTKQYRAKTKTMVAINEKLNMIAKFDLKTGMLTIEPIIPNKVPKED